MEVVKSKQTHRCKYLHCGRKSDTHMEVMGSNEGKKPWKFSVPENTSENVYITITVHTTTQALVEMLIVQCARRVSSGQSALSHGCKSG